MEDDEFAAFELNDDEDLDGLYEEADFDIPLGLQQTQTVSAPPPMMKFKTEAFDPPLPPVPAATPTVTFSSAPPSLLRPPPRPVPSSSPATAVPISPSRVLPIASTAPAAAPVVAVPPSSSSFSSTHASARVCSR